jgi:DNA invertase Pin-like site-specific DNA recombinase
VLVWALDRLERAGIEPDLRVMRQLRERGVQMIALQEPWTDAGAEMHELLAAIMAWAARMESHQRGERAGRACTPNSTRAAGRPPARGERTLTRLNS